MTSTEKRGSSPDKKDDKSKSSRDSERDGDRHRSPSRIVVSRDTNRNDPQSLRCRIFIGNLASDKVSRQELEDIFKQHGPVLACSVHTNFGFVQFSNEKDADQAVSKEHGRIVHGKKVDVNLAGERRKPMRGEKRPFEFNRPERERERSPPRSRHYDDDFPPSRFNHPEDRFGRRGSPPRGHPFPPRDGPPVEPHDHYRRGEPFERYERYREEDPYYRREEGAPYRDEPPPRRDPYYDRLDDRPPPRDSRSGYDDRAREPRNDRYREEVRSESLGSNYEREEYGHNGKRMKQDEDFDKSSYQKPGAPIDCEIVVVNKQQRGYSDLVERRLKGLGLITMTNFLLADQTLTEAIDDVARRGILYAIIITSQHEVHRSVTVNILHGTAQEHRNMPLEDAMNLVGKNFDAYMQDLRERSSKSSSSEPAPTYSSEILQLLSTASSGKALTAEQLTQLIEALQKQKDKLVAKDVKPEPSSQNRGVTESKPPVQDAASIAKQQAELQARILSILNPGSASLSPSTSTTPASATSNAALQSTTSKAPAAKGGYSSTPTRAASSTKSFDSGFAKPTAPAPRTGQSPSTSPYGQQQHSPGRSYSQQGYGQHSSPVSYPMSGSYSTRPGVLGSAPPGYGGQSSVAAATTLSNPSVQQALDKLMQSGLSRTIRNSPQGNSRPVMPPGFPSYNR